MYNRFLQRAKHNEPQNNICYICVLTSLNLLRIEICVFTLYEKSRHVYDGCDIYYVYTCPTLTGAFDGFLYGISRV